MTAFMENSPELRTERRSARGFLERLLFLRRASDSVLGSGPQWPVSLVQDRSGLGDPRATRCWFGFLNAREDTLMTAAAQENSVSNRVGGRKENGGREASAGEAAGGRAVAQASALLSRIIYGVWLSVL